MITKYISKKIDYLGFQLSPQFAYRNFHILGESIISFQGKADVKLEHMADIEDVINKEHIYSPLMLHFIIEHFDEDLEKMTIYQRLFISIIKETIEDITDKKIIRKGDDLFYSGRKLSVSIAAKTPVSCMIHTGLNIKTDDTPLETSGLGELGVQAEEFAHKVMESYKEEVESIRKARCKVRSVDY